MFTNSPSTKGRTLSPYVYITGDNCGARIAANLATGEVLELTVAEINALLVGSDDEDLFTHKGFLVYDTSAIRRRVVERHFKACQRPAVFNLTVLPTLACNLDCSYCFEKGVRPVRMPDEVATAIVALVERQAPRHLRIDLAWYGGEPLLQLDRITSLHPQIRKAAERAGCEFISSITTNGYCLDVPMALLFRDLGIHVVQVTIDGSPAIHDAHRHTRQGKGTFERIFTNLLHFLNAVPAGEVILRVNTETKTAASILAVLPDIPPALRNRVVVHIHSIMGIRPDNFSDEFASEVRTIYQVVRTLGFRAAVDHIDPASAVYCYAERSTSVVIDPRGWVFRCAYTDFSDQERIGMLNADGTIEYLGNFAASWEELVRTKPEKCFRCGYLPVCGFGCPRLRATTPGDTRCRNRFRFLPDTLLHLSFNTQQQE